MSFRFNNDLLLDETNQAAAKNLFPDIFFALDNAGLRNLFGKYDAQANSLKSRSRAWGIIAVGLATFALLIGSGENVLHHWLSSDASQGEDNSTSLALNIIIGVAAAAGILSMVIGFFGVMYRKRKRLWLHYRIATERLRLFHFQYLLACSGNIIDASQSKEKQEDFLKQRDAQLEAFKIEVLDHLDAELELILSDSSEGRRWLSSVDSIELTTSMHTLDSLMDAYERLRLVPQLQYAKFKLRRDGGFWDNAPRRQASVFRAIAVTCVILILALHAMVFLGVINGIESLKSETVHVMAIWAAIIALSSRTLEEGLQPEKELERMRHYSASIQLFYKRFQAAPDSITKWKIACEFEETSYEELLTFIKSSHEAKFIM